MPNTVFNYLQLVRAPAVFTALSNILAAHIIVTRGQIQGQSLLLLLMSSAVLYMAGMVLNDCFDFNEDSRDRPARPLPSGRVGIKTAWRLGWLLMIMGLISASLAGIKQFIIALLLSALIIFYNAYAKKTLFGSLVMGGCRYMNWLLGLSILPFTPEHFILTLPIFIYVSSLTLLSTEETTGTKRRTIVFSSIGMLICAVTILFIQFKAPHLQLLSGSILFFSLLLILFRMLKTYQDFSPLQIQKTIKMLVMGIIPLDALITLSNTYILGAIVILLLLLPGWMLGRSMRVT
jgi:4-hydroxybenzoate polyprenyltransferase